MQKKITQNEEKTFKTCECDKRLREKNEPSNLYESEFKDLQFDAARRTIVLKVECVCWRWEKQKSLRFVRFLWLAFVTDRQRFDATSGQNIINQISSIFCMWSMSRQLFFTLQTDEFFAIQIRAHFGCLARLRTPHINNHFEKDEKKI